MTKSCESRSKRRFLNGFTLLELMVVILVIGLAFGIASVAINNGGPEKDIEAAIDKFMIISEFAGERAILSSESMGLRLIPPQWQHEDYDEFDEAYNDIGWQYEWVSGSEAGWQPIPNYPKINLPPLTKLTILIDEVEWKWEEVLDRHTPLAVLYPSGDVSYIEIQFSHKDDSEFSQTVKVDESGELVWVELKERLEQEEEQ